MQQVAENAECWLVNCCLFTFPFATRMWYVPCFSRCSIHRRVQMLRLRLLVSFLHSLRKRMITPRKLKYHHCLCRWSHLCCAFCCSCTLAWLRTDFCYCSKLHNRSPQQKSACVIRVRFSSGKKVKKESRLTDVHLCDVMWWTDERRWRPSGRRQIPRAWTAVQHQAIYNLYERVYFIEVI